MPTAAPSLAPLSVALTLALSAPALAQTSRPAAEPELPPLGAPAGVFGSGVTLEEATPLPAIAGAPDRFAQRAVRVDGTISEVCQRRGCWMVLRDGEQAVRVRFQGYSFFVPRDAAGRRVLVQGTARVEEVPEEVARHYEEEGGHPERAAQIHGPQRVLMLMATGVVVLGDSALPNVFDAPPAVRDALAARVARGTPVSRGRPLAGAPAPVGSLAAALGLLRDLATTRTVEFTGCAAAGDWYVFETRPERAGARPFEHGFAVRRSDGSIVRF